MGAVKSNPAAFKPGCAPGPGRPPGARNKLTEIALATLSEHFAEFGKAAIDRVYREKPHAYLAIITSLLPRQLNVERSSVLGELSDEEIDLLTEYLAASRARTVRELEGTALIEQQEKS